MIKNIICLTFAKGSISISVSVSLIIWIIFVRKSSQIVIAMTQLKLRGPLSGDCVNKTLKQIFDVHFVELDF